MLSLRVLEKKPNNYKFFAISLVNPFTYLFLNSGNFSLKKNMCLRVINQNVHTQFLFISTAYPQAAFSLRECCTSCGQLKSLECIGILKSM